MKIESENSDKLLLNLMECFASYDDTSCDYSIDEIIKPAVEIIERENFIAGATQKFNFTSVLSCFLNI